MQKPSHVTNIHWKFHDFFPSSLGAIKVLHFTVRSEDGVRSQWKNVDVIYNLIKEIQVFPSLPEASSQRVPCSSPRSPNGSGRRFLQRSANARYTWWLWRRSSPSWFLPASIALRSKWRRYIKSRWWRRIVWRKKWLRRKCWPTSRRDGKLKKRQNHPQNSEERCSEKKYNGCLSVCLSARTITYA